MLKPKVIFYQRHLNIKTKKNTQTCARREENVIEKKLNEKLSKASAAQEK